MVTVRLLAVLVSVCTLLVVGLGAASGTSDTGSERIVFSRNESGVNNEIYSMNPDGTDVKQLTDEPSSESDPALSPDGRTIAFESTRDGNPEIYTMAADGGDIVRLTNSDAVDRNPAWSPDGTMIAFDSDSGTNTDVWVMNTDGTDAHNITNVGGIDRGPDWSPDGTKIVYLSATSGGLATISPDGTGKATLTFDGAPEGPKWSPDGTLIVYSDNDTDRIYSIAAAGGTPDELTSEEGFSPAWSPDGTMIVFERRVDGDPRLFVMNSDGSNEHAITDGPNDRDPDWGFVSAITRQGDIDCDGVVGPIDALKLLRFDSGLDVAQNDGCPEIGEELAGGLVFGDLDCDDAVNPVDSLKTLRFDAGLSVAQGDDCPAPGEAVQV